MSRRAAESNAVSFAQARAALPRTANRVQSGPLPTPLHHHAACSTAPSALRSLAYRGARSPPPPPCGPGRAVAASLGGGIRVEQLRLGASNSTDVTATPPLRARTGRCGWALSPRLSSGLSPARRQPPRSKARAGRRLLTSAGSRGPLWLGQAGMRSVARPARLVPTRRGLRSWSGTQPCARPAQGGGPCAPSSTSGPGHSLRQRCARAHGTASRAWQWAGSCFALGRPSEAGGQRGLKRAGLWGGSSRRSSEAQPA